MGCLAISSSKLSLLNSPLQMGDFLHFGGRRRTGRAITMSPCQVSSSDGSVPPAQPLRKAGDEQAGRSSPAAATGGHACDPVESEQLHAGLHHPQRLAWLLESTDRAGWAGCFFRRHPLLCDNRSLRCPADFVRRFLQDGDPLCSVDVRCSPEDVMPSWR